MSWKITDVGSNIDNTVFDDWVTRYGSNSSAVGGWNWNNQPWQGSIEEQLLYNNVSQSDIDLINRMPVCIYDPSLAETVTACTNPDDFVSVPYMISHDGNNNYVYYTVYNISSGVIKLVTIFYMGYTPVINAEAYISNEYCGCGYNSNGNCTDSGASPVET